MKLRSKRAFVTGAGRGIGRGIAVELAKAGASVWVNDYQDNDDVAETIGLCQDAGGEAAAAIADVADRAAMKDLISRLAGDGGIDIAVSNAAYSDRFLMLEQDEAEFDRTIAVSLMGAYHTVRYAAAAMVDAGRGGSIVMISSPHAHLPIPGAVAYNIAKAGCDQLANTAACELAGHKIRVNTIHPGWIDTPGERKFFTEEAIADGRNKIPLGRLGTPAEIGRGVVFLCDPESSYMTGSTLTIDGGIQLPYEEMYRIEQARRQGGG